MQNHNLELFDDNNPPPRLSARASLKQKEDTQAERLMVPGYDSHLRLAANCLIRSALFTIQKLPLQRERVEQEIFTLTGTRIFYKGPTLNQYDLEVYLAVLFKFQTKVDFDDGIYTSLYGLLKDINHHKNPLTSKDSKPSVKEFSRLRASLDRLYEADLEININNLKSKNITYKGHLISQIMHSDEVVTTGKHKAIHLRLTPEIVRLFQTNMFTLVQWDFHKSLSPLAQYLHCFYMSHAKPNAYSLDKLMRLTGTKSKNKSSFKQALTKAMQELQPNVVDTFVIKDGLLYVTRKGKQDYAQQTKVH